MLRWSPRLIRSAFSTIRSKSFQCRATSIHSSLRMAASSTDAVAFYLPAETMPHQGTIMAWPSRSSILDCEWPYPVTDVAETRREIAEIAKTIAKYEHLYLFVTHPDTSPEAATSFEAAKEAIGDNLNVTIVPTPNVDCLWARDTGPIYVYQARGDPVTTDWLVAGDSGSTSSPNTIPLIALILSFNQWGRKCSPTVDSYFAATAAASLSHPARLAPFIAEGGAIEVDGDGTMLATESSILNPNRNPGIDKKTMESYFATAFGITKTIWFEGTRGGDITDDHIDALARFAGPGVVLLSKPFVDETWTQDDKDKVLKGYLDAREVLNTATDAKGRSFRIVDLQEPKPTSLNISQDVADESGAVVSYVNYHVVNGAVILCGFGDKEADQNARKVIEREFPGRVVEQVLIRQLGIQGGGIHCATQQILA